MTNTILLTDDAKLHGSQWLADIPLRAGSQSAQQLRSVQGVRAPITIGPFHADDAIVFLADVTGDVETWRVYKAADTAGLGCAPVDAAFKIPQRTQVGTQSCYSDDGRMRAAHDLRAFVASARWTESTTHGIELSTDDAAELLSRVQRCAVPEPTSYNKGTQLIAEERTRQLQKWSPKHDGEHDGGELAVRAAELAVLHTAARVNVAPDFTPDAWKLGAQNHFDPVRCLTIAGALIAAEIDRLLGEK